MRTGFVTTAQFGARMRGLQFGEEFKHVVMRAANDPVTPDLGGIRGRETHGDGVGVNVQPDEEDPPVGGCGWSPEKGAGGGGPRGGGRGGPGWGFFLQRTS